MKKQFIFVLAALIVLANGASVALADKVSDSDNSSSSTTVASRPNNDNKAAREKRNSDEKSARAAKVLGATNARNAIMATFKTAMASAFKSKYSALNSARTVLQRKAAIDNFNIGVAAANEAMTTALKALSSGKTTTTATTTTTTTTTVKP